MASLASVALPPVGKWLNCPPMPALGLHLRGNVFVFVKVRISLTVFNTAGPQ